MEENTFISVPEKKKNPFFKRIIKIFFWIIFLILLLAGALLTLLFVYEDEVKAEIITELNRHLNVEVKIDPKNIDLTILKTFPDCSIEFKDVLMYEALKQKERDTLLFAGRLNLFFNIEDLWNKKYEIEKIKLKDGVAKLRILKDGQNNFSFWKKTQDSTSTGDSLDFRLKLIQIENCRLSYKDRPNSFKISTQLKKVKFSGHFGDSNFEMTSDIKAFIHELSIDKTIYLREKNCDLDLQLDVNDKSYQLRKAEISLNKLFFNINGNFEIGKKLERMSLSYEAPNLEIAAFLSLLPEKFKDKINDYESTGDFYAKGNLRYSLSAGYSSINDFGIKGGTITYKPQSTKAEHVNVKGHLELTDKTSFLDLKGIHLNLNSDEIKGECSISNFSDPNINANVAADLNLENLQKFWPIDTLQALKGKIKLIAEVKGLLKDLKANALAENVTVNFDTRISDIEVQFKQDDKKYASQSGEISVRDREVLVKDLKLKRGSSDMSVSGRVPGLFKYMLDRSLPLTVTGSLRSNFIQLEDFMFVSGKSGSSNSKDLIPANVNLNLDAEIEKFKFGKFDAQEIRGDIEIRNQKLMVSDMKFNTMQGEAVFQAFADNSHHKLEVVIQSNLKNINITDLFYQMNNFGQTTLTQDHLKGVASASIEFSGTWNNKLEVDSRSIKSVCNLVIDGGELIDFKPLLSLSKFVDVNELKRIKFSSLKSNIEIKNRTIYIPKTAIKNSALDIDLSGSHSFDNVIDYRIQLLISDLIAKKRKKKDDEFGPVEKDKTRRSAFISMTGTVDNPIIKYDKMGLKEKIRTDIKEEKHSLKQLLYDEFGFFKKDSALKKPKTEAPAFEVEKAKPAPANKPLEPKKKKEEEDDF